MNAAPAAGGVFPTQSLNRRDIRWEDHLQTLTPVTLGASGIYYKREDHFAPLGYGGINGSKLRQLIYLVDRHRKLHPEVNGILTGASVLSPQNSMAALVGAHYRLPVTVVLGATKPSTAPRHENVAIAAQAGARFIYTPVGFNPALQAAVARTHERDRYRDHYRLCYGITTPQDADPGHVTEFHAVGAPQVANIPTGVKTLTMTAGSCNSATSVLYGLSRFAPPSLERVALIGIGPSRLAWMRNRLGQIRDATGVDAWSQFTRRFHHHPELNGGNGPILLEHYDLHATGWTNYQAKRKWSQDGITFHPTYEGKAMAYLNERRPHWWANADADVLFWIVGSAGTRTAMAAALQGAKA